jgi:replicative DNA helicase
MNLSAESKIIGYFLLTEDLIQIVQIETKLFQSKFHREIYQKINFMEKKKIELTTANLKTELNRDTNEDTEPLLNILVDLAYEVEEVFDLPVLIKELEEAFLRLQCLELALTIQKISTNKTLNALDLVNAVKESVDVFVEGTPMNEQYPLRYLAEGILIKLDTLKSECQSTSSGLPALDDVIQGLSPKELIILGGRPADGKTYTGLIIADSVAKTGKPVVFFSAEMSLEALGSRYLGKEYFAEYSEILPSAKLAGREILTEQEKLRIEDLYDKLIDLPLIVQDKPGSLLTVADIKNNLLETKKTHGQIGLVVIDYLQLITSKKESGLSFTYAIGEMLGSLKALAHQFNCPFLLLAQLSSAKVATRSNKRPLISDICDSMEAEKFAEKVLLLHRPSKYDEEADPSDLEIIVAKNRNGIEGSIKCSFNMQTGILKSVE